MNVNEENKRRQKTEYERNVNKEQINRIRLKREIGQKSVSSRTDLLLDK